MNKYIVSRLWQNEHLLIQRTKRHVLKKRESDLLQKKQDWRHRKKEDKLFAVATYNTKELN